MIRQGSQRYSTIQRYCESSMGTVTVPDFDRLGWHCFRSICCSLPWRPYAGYMVNSYGQDLTVLAQASLHIGVAEPDLAGWVRVELACYHRLGVGTHLRNEPPLRTWRAYTQMTGILTRRVLTDMAVGKFCFYLMEPTWSDVRASDKRLSLCWATGIGVPLPLPTDLNKSIASAIDGAVTTRLCKYIVGGRM